MDVEISEDIARLVIDLLRNWGPDTLSLDEEKDLNFLATALENCICNGSTLHIKGY